MSVAKRSPTTVTPPRRRSGSRGDQAPASPSTNGQKISSSQFANSRPELSFAQGMLPRPVSTSSLPTYKILLIGDAAVGKSNLLSRFASNAFDIASRSTIGVEFVSREVNLPTERDGSNERVNIQLWDTAGQERCGSISSAFFRSAKGVAVVYDVTRKSSLLNVPRWVAHAKQFADENCVFIVIGNKTDLPNLKEVSEEEAEEISHILGVRHFYSSALTGEGVPNAFLQLILAVNALVRTQEIASPKYKESPPSKRGGPIDISSVTTTDTEKDKTSCCS